MTQYYDQATPLRTPTAERCRLGTVTEMTQDVTIIDQFGIFPKLIPHHNMLSNLTIDTLYYSIECL